MPSVSPEILNARSQKDDQFPQCFEREKEKVQERHEDGKGKRKRKG